jgi:hypothetical protein
MRPVNSRISTATATAPGAASASISHRRLGRIAASAAVTAVFALGAVALATPASAAPGIVDLPATPAYTAVDCTPANSASVATPAELNTAYTDPAINCISLTADITFTAGAPFTGVATVLARPMQIDGAGHTLTFGAAGATGNRPFYLANQASPDAGLTLALRNMDVVFGYDAYLVSGQSEQAQGWNIVFDGVTMQGITGYGSGSPNGRPVSAYLADVYLEGSGSAANTYGRFFPRNIIVATGADWTIKAAAAAPNEPQFDMSYGLAFGPAGSGSVYVGGTLDVEGGAFSAIWSFHGIYVASSGDLTAASNYNGYAYGALTTAGGTAGTGQIWVDDNGGLTVTNPAGIAIYAVAGAPLDLRTDPGARVDITGMSESAWPAGMHLGTITLATGGSSLQFNSPAHLDIKNLGDNVDNNWAITSLYNAGVEYDYTLSIYDTTQVATWLHGTPIASNPDLSWDAVTLLTNADGTALAGSTPPELVAAWNTHDYRRIFLGDVIDAEIPAVAPGVALGAAAVALGGAGVGATALVRRRRATAATANHRD